MKKETFLLAQNDHLLNEIIGDLKHFNPLLQKMKAAYENLEIGPFSDEVMTEINEVGVSSIKTKFDHKIDTELKKTGITSKLIRENLLNGSKEQFAAFENAVEEAENFKPRTSPINQRPTLSFGYISYEAKGNRIGKFVISEDDKENLLERYCRTYLRTEGEKQLYGALYNFMEAYSILKQGLENVKYSFDREGYELNELNRLFFKNKNGELELKPESIGIAVNQFALLKKRHENQQRAAKLTL